MLRSGFLWGLLFLVPLAIGQSNEDFDDPPTRYRPKFRYWLPDASVSSEAVTKDIHAAKEAGAGGLELLPFFLYGKGIEMFTREGAEVIPNLPDWSEYGFGTPAFVSLFKSALEAAQDANLPLDYSIGANQGQGVPSEIATQGLAVELLMGQVTVASQTTFDARVPPAEQPSALLQGGMGFMHPIERLNAPNLTAVIAYQIENETGNETGTSTVQLRQDSFVDLTSLVTANNTLQWSPLDTSSSWKIFSFWEAYTNQRSCDGGPNATTFLGNGSWIVDHFSKTGASRITEFWDEYILSDAQIASLLGSIGNYAWEDSMEMLAALYWTPGLPDRFRNNTGYDLVPYLPILFSQSNTWNKLLPVYNETYAFGNYTSDGDSVYQIDYRNALNDGYKDYLKHLQDWVHSTGNELRTQPAYNLPLQALSDIPLVDIPEGESLGFSETLDVYRQFTGPAHLADKQVISTELGAVMTAPYWLTVPDLLQKIGRSLAGGFTMHVIHGYPTLAPYPNTTWPGYTPFNYIFTDMWNPIQPAWQHMKDSLDFVARNQWVLQQGQPKLDLAIYAYAAPWTIVERYNPDNLRHLGYSYDYLGPDNLVSSDAFVTNNKLGVPEYKAVVFSNDTVITVEAVEALNNFASQGLKLVFVGAPPTQSYPVDADTQASLKSAMERLLSGPNVYRINSTEELPSVLQENGVNPRVSLDCTPNSIYTIYRSVAEVDYVYLFNDQNETQKCDVGIDAAGVVPYTYDAWTGSQSPLLQFTTFNTSIYITPTLKANESLIIALHRNTSQPTCTLAQGSSDIRSVADSGGNLQAVVTSSPYVLTTSTGKETHFNGTLPSPTNLTTWELNVEDWHSVPDRFAIENEITNHIFHNVSLVPWSQINASLQSVSGIGNYTVNFEAPADADFSSLVGYLNLPLIQHTARVYLDGEWLGPINPVNPVVPLKNLEKGRAYELRIDVSTTLFNRVKAEADLVWMVGQVSSKATDTYATLPYEDYGLVGHVWIDWGYSVEVQC